MNGRAKVTILLVVRVVIALRFSPISISNHFHIDDWVPTRQSIGHDFPISGGNQPIIT
jgi:hypothetical protein